MGHPRRTISISLKTYELVKSHCARYHVTMASVTEALLLAHVTAPEQGGTIGLPARGDPRRAEPSAVEIPPTPPASPIPPIPPTRPAVLPAAIPRTVDPESIFSF